MTEILLDETWYLPTYLKNKTDPGVTMITRHFRVRRTARGFVKLDIKSDAPEFADDDAMVEAIELGGWRELPHAADGDPRYVPVQVQQVVEKARLEAKASR